MRSRIVMMAIMAALCLGLIAGSEAFLSSEGGFTHLPAITKEEHQAMPDATGTVMLTTAGVPLPYDPASNTYFIPQDRAREAFDGHIQIESAEGWTHSVYPGQEITKERAIEKSIGYTVWAQKDGQTRKSKALFTGLPVIMLETATGDDPTEEDGTGMLRMFTVENGRIAVTESLIEINLRGNTSKHLPKQSWRVKLVDKEGNGRQMSLAGMRVDDDWILNPMYTDASKVRETLSYELWAQINSSGQHAASSAIGYAEVFLNGSYWGLYGVQERVDRKQVGADKRGGLLYKVATNDRPTAEELLACDGTETCRAFEIVHAGPGVENIWQPAAAYMAALEGSDARDGAILSLSNVIDYGLWAMITQAHDCHFKNQFLHCVYGKNGYVMYKLPWDLNNTLGDVYRLALTENNNTDFYIGSPVMDGAFEALLDLNDPQVIAAVQTRWAEIRREITPDSVALRAEEIYASIAPAVERDGRRWPESGYGYGNEDTSTITEFIDEMLPRIDAYIATLGSEKAGGW